jgi:tRNA(Ile)-lysidine synthase
VVLEREAGEAARGGLRPLALEAGKPMVWDGRFEITADRPGLVIEPLRGRAAILGPEDRAHLARLPASARPALPLWRKLDDAAGPPRLALAAPHAHLQDNGVRCQALSQERLAAAAGVVAREVQIGTNPHMAHLPVSPYVEAGSKD